MRYIVVKTMKHVKDAILLTGGEGTRLRPATLFFSKHLLQVNNKFIIDYPLKTLQDLNIENLTVVLGGAHFQQIVEYLKDGSDWDMNIQYVYQQKPAGIAQAINLCKNQVKSDQFVVLLGDNLYSSPIKFSNSSNAQIVLCEHPELHRFGVASCDASGKIIKIEEKPKIIDKSYKNYAITGCYLFTQDFFEYFKQIKPSNRNEYEVAHIIELYLKDNKLDKTIIQDLWSDAGTPESIAYLNHYFYSGDK